ncbi:GerMN domain-containing protein [Nocardioides dilutus]
MSRRRPGRTATTVAALLVTALLSSCGLPGEGSVTRVDGETVPYDLLESGAPSSRDAEGSPVPGPVPMVFWLVGDERLVPSAAGASCDQPPELAAARLLEELAAGPTEDARAAGRSTAIPPESALTLVDVAEGTAQVAVAPETPISAERLPAAVGQIVLTVTSVAGVGSVLIVSSAGPVQVPLPGGALTGGPVTAEDYSSLLPDRFEQLPVGCPETE